MSQRINSAAPEAVTAQMESLSLGTASISDADWILSALVRRTRVGPTEEGFIDAPDQMALLRATIALGLHLPEVIFGALGLYIRLLETGIIGPALGPLLGNYDAHCALYGKFNRKVFSDKSKFNISPFIEELDKHDPEGHVAFFGEHLKLLGAIDWNYEGTDKAKSLST
ncbi:hypothetical protein DL769_001274 [Monosporascus sp. CRB-8-3]|nr:hypothetical protein DL769_001274 [Monosporascus sp. CRB-8-3]